MATLHIHEDQENISQDFRQKTVGYIENGNQKRAVLGLLDNKQERLAIAKQVPGQINTKSSNHNEENQLLHNCKQQREASVPVAQFQAFKVYEDSFDKELEKKLMEHQKRNKQKDVFANVYKGTHQDRLITKKEVKEQLEKQEMICNSPFELKSFASNDEQIEPMSIEKSLTCEHDPCSIVSKSKTCRDTFFEMAEYRDEIFVYLKEQEKLHRPKPGYMRKQSDITYNMRTILIDWLVEVTEEYKLHTETLYLAVNYIDRFLSFMSVVRAKLQLVGTAAMFIAAKYEEIYPPDVGEFVYITDDTYTKRQVIRMEMLILRILDFNLPVPTSYTFIAAICISHKLQEKVMHMAMYLSELSLLDAEPYLETFPSVMAASSIAISKYYCEGEMWSNELTEISGYKLSDLVKTIKFLNELLEKAPKMTQQAIQEKYRHSKYLSVSNVKARSLPSNF